MTGGFDGSAIDLGLHPDAVAALDAATADGNSPDAGIFDSASADATTATAADAGTTDAGPSIDGAIDDAAVIDATAVDATAMDAMIIDSATTDAMVIDANGPDVGTAGDASLGPDAGVGPDGGGDCSSSRDCNPGETCHRITLLNNMFRTRCGAPNPTPPAVATGAPCTNDNECTDNLCLDNLTSECTVICDDPAQDCPAGFACAGFVYNGATTVRHCVHACRRNADCMNNNVCSTQSYQVGGGWQLDRICIRPSGMGELGEACGGGGDCASGICLRTRRGVGCTGPGGCDADEMCECANGQAPPCAGGGAALCISRACTSPCADATDCANSPFVGNRLTVCTSSITFTLPDMTQSSILTCTRN